MLSTSILFPPISSHKNTVVIKPIITSTPQPKHMNNYNCEQLTPASIVIHPYACIIYHKLLIQYLYIDSQLTHAHETKFDL